jgi:hypothetical protein
MFQKRRVEATLSSTVRALLVCAVLMASNDAFAQATSGECGEVLAKGTFLSANWQKTAAVNNTLAHRIFSRSHTADEQKISAGGEYSYLDLISKEFLGFTFDAQLRRSVQREYLNDYQSSFSAMSGEQVQLAYGDSTVVNGWVECWRIKSSQPELFVVGRRDSAFVGSVSVQLTQGNSPIVGGPTSIKLDTLRVYVDDKDVTNATELVSGSCLTLKEIQLGGSCNISVRFPLGATSIAVVNVGSSSYGREVRPAVIPRHTMWVARSETTTGIVVTAGTWSANGEGKSVEFFPYKRPDGLLVWPGAAHNVSANVCTSDASKPHPRAMLRDAQFFVGPGESGGTTQFQPRKLTPAEVGGLSKVCHPEITCQGPNGSSSCRLSGQFQWFWFEEVAIGGNVVVPPATRPLALDR